MSPFDVVVGITGLLLLGKLIFGSIAAGMNDAQEELSAPEGWAAQGRRRAFENPVKSTGLALGAVLMIGFFTYRVFTGSDPGERPADAPPTPPWAGGPVQVIPAERTIPAQGGLPGEPTPEEEAMATAASVLRAERAVLKVRQREAAAQGRGVLEMVRAWEQEMDLWDTGVSSLWENDKGKALAAQPHLVRRYRALLDLERPGREEAESVRDSAETLLEPVQAALDDPADGLTPDAELTGQLQELLRKAREGRDAYRKPRIQVEALVSNALSSGETGSRSLAEVAREQAEEEALAATTLIEAEADKAREEKARAIAAAAKLQIEAEQKAEVDRIAAETEAKRMLGEQTAERIRQEAAIADAEMKQELEARVAEAKDEERRRHFERAWPAMQGYMTPFTSMEYTQPGNDSYRVTTVNGPVSFSALQGSGFLNDDVATLQKFQDRTRMYSRRPLGAFPWTAYEFHKDQATLQKIQYFLRDYGDIMVEKGYLAK